MFKIVGRNTRVVLGAGDNHLVHGISPVIAQYERKLEETMMNSSVGVHMTRLDALRFGSTTNMLKKYPKPMYTSISQPVKDALSYYVRKSIPHAKP